MNEDAKRTLISRLWAQHPPLDRQVILNTCPECGGTMVVEDECADCIVLNCHEHFEDPKGGLLVNYYNDCLSDLRRTEQLILETK